MARTIKFFALIIFSSTLTLLNAHTNYSTTPEPICTRQGIPAKFLADYDWLKSRYHAHEPSHELKQEVSAAMHVCGITKPIVLLQTETQQHFDGFSWYLRSRDNTQETVDLMVIYMADKQHLTQYTRFTVYHEFGHIFNQDCAEKLSSDLEEKKKLSLVQEKRADVFAVRNLIKRNQIGTITYNLMGYLEQLSCDREHDTYDARRQNPRPHPDYRQQAHYMLDELHNAGIEPEHVSDRMCMLVNQTVPEWRRRVRFVRWCKIAGGTAATLLAGAVWLCARA